MLTQALTPRKITGVTGNPLKNYHILLVDSDTELVRVLRALMREMGFVNCDVTSSGLDAYHMMQNEPYDFLITDWNTNHITGMELLKRLRKSPDSPHPTVPAIMLTGRAEQSDVILARDAGVNEYVVKPFSVKSIFSRIERIVENPRQFVITREFVGPTRRVHSAPPPGQKERRFRKVQPQLQPVDIHGAMRAADTPRIWLPDFSLKYKLGTNTRLESIITDAVLKQAQAAVDAISEQSLSWVKENLNEMRKLQARMAADNAGTGTSYELGELALTVNSRAGTFGYGRASEIAYLLYLFCRNSLIVTNKSHQMVVAKHIDVLHVILGNRMLGSAGALGDQMVAELKKLAGKFVS